MSDTNRDLDIQEAYRDLFTFIKIYDIEQSPTSKRNLREHLEYMLGLGRGYFSSIDKKKVDNLLEQLESSDDYVKVNIL